MGKIPDNEVTFVCIHFKYLNRVLDHSFMKEEEMCQATICCLIQKLDRILCV